MSSRAAFADLKSLSSQCPLLSPQFQLADYQGSANFELFLKARIKSTHCVGFVLDIMHGVFLRIGFFFLPPHSGII